MTVWRADSIVQSTLCTANVFSASCHTVCSESCEIIPFILHEITCKELSSSGSTAYNMLVYNQNPRHNLEQSRVLPIFIFSLHNLSFQPWHQIRASKSNKEENERFCKVGQYYTALPSSSPLWWPSWSHSFYKKGSDSIVFFFLCWTLEVAALLVFCHVKVLHRTVRSRQLRIVHCW